VTSIDILRREPDVRHVPQGATIFNQGDAADCMFAVVEGQVEIRINGTAIETICSGGVFGEMALIDSSVRSGSAIAATDCTLAAISEKRFLRLVELTPQFALQVMRVITERLRRSGAH
jgi:CRP-like cAMP-binding protein